MRSVLLGTGLCLLAVALTGPRAVGQTDNAALAAQAKKILTATCHRCHGQDGRNEGGFNFILSVPQLIARKKIVPGNVAASKLVKKIKAGDMPPKDDDGKAIPQLSADDTTALEKWIAAGAPDFSPPVTKRDFITPEQMLRDIRDDLEKANERDRRFLRYFTLTHLSNAGLSEDELQSYRHGLSKLVNSLSWGRTIKAPQPVDSARTVLRIDLRDYKWSEKTWDQILAANPYGITYGSAAARACYQMTQSALPHVRADWFVFAASRPPLYHDVLKLPKSDRELEKLLQVDVAEDIRQERVVRAGFNGSGVSRNNRLVERHESSYGAYWKSYDFAKNTDRKNLFEHPLGPGDDDKSFQHDGGEIIFNLPNGLQAYFLADGKGNRIDKGPTNIVSDPKQGDRAVVNGISCMSCHARGMIEKADQVREHVQKNRDAFSRAEADTILTLYPGKARLAELFGEDAERFAAAVKKTGAQLSSTEPIVALALRFEQELDVNLAAAEAGLKTEEFLKGLEQSARLKAAFGPLRVEGGTIQREVLVAGFADLVRELKLGDFLPGFDQDGPTTLTELQGMIGKTFRFRVTGSATGTIYGTGTYTADSSLATAAVHAGLLKAGQTGIVKVTIVAPLDAYKGSVKNGVTSYDYGPWPGAYQVSPAGAAPTTEEDKVEDGPVNLSDLQRMIGKTFRFRVTGSATGTIYGTGTYTADSPLATVAVHAGILKAGQTGIVKVTIVAPLDAYQGSEKNGVTSSDYGEWPGAYQVSPPGAAPRTEEDKVEDGPETLTGLQGMVGKTFRFRVTGSATGTIWGTGTYTADSPLATVAVHAGILKAGQTGIVKVTIVAPLDAYQGSEKNGVTSSDYGTWPGAYQVSR
jgi:mono/diheme cytochrome c family protein